MKKILVLGATSFQIPVINYARSEGHYVITCDYLPENPGHALAHEWHNVSTTDKEAVLKLAQQLNIDGILAFASDPAAPTAAYVAEKMKLPGNAFEVVRMMAEKDLFRAFLSSHDFNVPQFGSYTDLESLMSDLLNYTFPVIIKPVDSSGSKGVHKVELARDTPHFFNLAVQHSRSKRVIVEAYILGPQFHGDAFVDRGEVIFSYTGDHCFNGFLVSSTSYPSNYPVSLIQQLENEVKRFIKAIGFTNGGINIELRVSDLDHKIYLIEIGPRNGGHFTPQIIQLASGFDFVKAAVDTAMGLPFERQQVNKEGFYTNMVLYSKQPGLFHSVEWSEKLKACLLSAHIYKKVGDAVFAPQDSSTAVGVLLLKFSSSEEQQEVMRDPFAYYRVKVLPN